MVQAGIYARVSVKHGDRKENTIRHQILLARDWIQKKKKEGQAIAEYQCYVDYGYSGTHFNRPGFQTMMQDAKTGKIQCIICKDASRLGRNYLAAGEYMEQIFPTLGIRFVCISEGYDSEENMPGSLGMNMRNLMYQWYARDISRKVRLVKEQKRQRGEYLGSRAPYGFCICHKEGKRLLQKDQAAEKIIEQIYLWHQSGMSLGEIRTRLWKQGVCPPAEYSRTGRIYGTKEMVKPWDCSTIRRVLLSYTRGDYHTA